MKFCFQLGGEVRLVRAEDGRPCSHERPLFDPRVDSRVVIRVHLERAHIWINARVEEAMEQ